MSGDPLEESLRALGSAGDLEILERERVSVLGKNGWLTLQFVALSSCAPEEKRSRGRVLNGFKGTYLEALAKKREALQEEELTRSLSEDSVDVSLPPRPNVTATLHPLTRVWEDVVALLQTMGFVVAEGPDIEDDDHNFSALNFVPHHPARQAHDTFYLEREDHPLLRTHTSSVQVHVLREGHFPLRVMVPGRAYRADHDATHTPMFHQLEALVVDKEVHFGHLRGCLETFIRLYFGRDDIPVRFRPSFFPFTTPSAEMDIQCRREGGSLIVGEGGWMEILGCGMVHPKVLENCAVDPMYQGFAFGVGLERLAMLKYGLPDIRPFFDSDLRWLQHYGFSPFEGTGA